MLAQRLDSNLRQELMKLAATLGANGALRLRELNMVALYTVGTTGAASIRRFASRPRWKRDLLIACGT
jgi:hypothetical protein